MHCVLLQGFAFQGYVTGEGPYANCESSALLQAVFV